MKKFFTLIAAALIAVSANAVQTEIPLSGWGWGWSADTSNDASGNLVVSVSADNGAGSTGWDPASDWSSYKSITAIIESCTIPEGGYAQMQVKYKDAAGKDQTLTGSISTNITTQTPVTIVFDDPSILTSVTQLWFQGSKGTTFNVSKVYLENELAESETEDLSLTGWGWGWSADTSNDADGNLVVSVTADNGAGSTGWDPAVDWSGYVSLTAVIESCTVPEGGYAQVQVKYKDANDKDQTLTGSISSSITSQTSVTVKFDDPSILTKVVQLWFQGSKGAAFTVSRVYLSKASDGISSISADDANVVKSEYFNVAGQKINGSSKGLTIVKQTLSNGKTVSKKVVLK